MTKEGGLMAESTNDWSRVIESTSTAKDFRNFHWEGSFFDYLDIVKKNPQVTRNAFQRMYDMVLSWGTSNYVEYKKNIIRYKFFEDPIDNGKDAVYGLDVPVMKLVHFFKSAAFGYGTEKRVLLLHGPVGSAKSTIARLLKKGIERYSRTEEGAMYTFRWIDKEKGDILGHNHEMKCPM